MNPLGTASVLGGRFRLVEPVRNGDPDGAWRAVDEDLGAEVAIKPLGVYLAGDAVAQARFRHAARAMLQLSGPGIAQVRDYGESPLPGARVLLYLARDLAGGQTLDQRLAEGPLTAGEALRAAASVAAALETAYQAGVPHGHLVPANIVLGPGTVTVTDFGLPAPRDGHAEPSDRTGLSYLAPELGHGSPASPAADMYALGVVFVACLAGIPSATVRAGAAAGSATAGAGAAGLAGPAAPGALAQEPVPAAIAALWASCLGPDPAQRPTAARAVALSRQVLSSQPQASGQPGMPMAPDAAGSPVPAPPGPHPVGPTRTRYHAAQRIRGVLDRGGQATRAHRVAGAGAAAALIAVVTAASFLVSSLNAQPAAHVSAATGTPSTSTPSATPQASSGPAGAAPGTDGNGQLASPPATSATVPCRPAVSASPRRDRAARVDHPRGRRGRPDPPGRRPGPGQPDPARDHAAGLRPARARAAARQHAAGQDRDAAQRGRPHRAGSRPAHR